jgi:hypothetical protein
MYFQEARLQTGPVVRTEELLKAAGRAVVCAAQVICSILFYWVYNF